MTGGVGAAIILRDLIVDGSSPWAEVFDPMRITPKASAKSFAEENATIAANYATDWGRAMLSENDLPAPGDGTIVRRDGRPIAIHRDMDGNLHAVSAVCTHLWCLVRWNDAEKTWDCPCHGSRFSCDGEVLSGPALEGLRQVYPNGE
jgi:Rieske Fe-S protein